MPTLSLPLVLKRSLQGVALVALLLAFGARLAPAHTARAQSDYFELTVNATNDAVDLNPGDGVCDSSDADGEQCTLRAAIMEANAYTGGLDIWIHVPAHTYALSLTGSKEDAGATGDLDIRASMTVEGDDPANPAMVWGPAGDRVVDIGPVLLTPVTPTVTIRNMIIGNGTIASGCIGTSGCGGAGIHNQAYLTLENVSVYGNIATQSMSDGAGILNDSGATLSLADCWIHDNYGRWGGGIFNDGTMTARQTTIDHNHATQSGAGMVNHGPASLVNCTISANTADVHTGGISNWGELKLGNVTLAGNGAPDLAGNFGQSDPRASVTFRNSIVANPSESVDYYCGNDHCMSEGYNLCSDGSCPFTAPGDLKGTDPRLGPLQDNGGPTMTQALLPGSPAQDHGNPAGCKDFSSPVNQLIIVDQRYVWRPLGPRCDSGAYEAYYYRFLPLALRS